MPTLRVNSGTGHCIGFVRDDALPLADNLTNQALISDQTISASVAEVVPTNNSRTSAHAMHKSGTSVGRFKPGQIIFADAKVSCTIRNMSSFGASIEISPRANIPDQFVLLVSSDRKSYACHVVRRKGVFA